jgi:hypothetical protein
MSFNIGTTAHGSTYLVQQLQQWINAGTFLPGRTYFYRV